MIKSITAGAVAILMICGIFGFIIYRMEGGPELSREMIALRDCQRLAADHKQVYFDVYYDDKDGSQAECKRVIVDAKTGLPSNSYKLLFSRGIAAKGTPLRPH